MKNDLILNKKNNYCVKVIINIIPQNYVNEWYLYYWGDICGV